MIDLYTWGTPNGRKVSVMLEECALAYRVLPVNLDRGDQYAEAFRAINPYGRIPAIVDSDAPAGRPQALWESGAILLYLAEKSGAFMPRDSAERLAALQWLMFQMSTVGPAFGQLHHFLHTAPERVPYATERFRREKDRVYRMLDQRLGHSEYLAGPEYSIADIATYPWVARHERHQTDLSAFPNVQRWFDRIGGRPAVQRGMAIPEFA
jgi:GST-like protein